jgi:hypothetical protein
MSERQNDMASIVKSFGLSGVDAYPVDEETVPGLT